MGAHDVLDIDIIDYSNRDDLKVHFNLFRNLGLYSPGSKEQSAKVIRIVGGAWPLSSRTRRLIMFSSGNA